MPQIDTSLLLTVNAASILRAPTPQIQKRNGVRYHSLPPLPRQTIEPTRQPEPQPPRSIVRTEHIHSNVSQPSKVTADGFKVPGVPKARKSLPTLTQAYSSSPALVLKRKLSDLYSKKIPTIPSKVPTIESTEKISTSVRTDSARVHTVTAALRAKDTVAEDTRVKDTVHGRDVIEPPKRSRGRPRKDGTPAQARMKPPSKDASIKASEKTPILAEPKPILSTKVLPKAQTTSTTLPFKASVNEKTNAPSSISVLKQSPPIKRPRGRPRKDPLATPLPIPPPPKHRTPSPVQDEPINGTPRDEDEYYSSSEPTRSGRSIKAPSDWWSTTRRSSGESLPRLTWGEMPPDTPRRREGSLARDGSLVRHLGENSGFSTRYTAETPLAQRGRSKLGMSVFMPSPPPEPAIDPVLLADTTLTDLKQGNSSQSIEALPDSQGEEVIVDSAEEEWSSMIIPVHRNSRLQNANVASDDEDYRPRPQKLKKARSSKVSMDPDLPKRPRGRPRKYPLPHNNGKDREKEKQHRSSIQSGLSTAFIQHVTAVPSLPNNNTMSWHFSDED